LVQGSDEPSSTDVIDLDDVLDASMLDSEPTYDSDEPSKGPWATSKIPVGGTHVHNLNRWDRIPVAAFRRTRETSKLETTSVSESGTKGRFASTLNNDMLGTPKQGTKSRTLLKNRSKGKANLSSCRFEMGIAPQRTPDRQHTIRSINNRTLFTNIDLGGIIAKTKY
jgi:hypothetical protein